MAFKNKIIVISILIVFSLSVFLVFNKVSAAADLQETIPKLRIKIPEILTEFHQPIPVKECPGEAKTCAPEEKISYIYIPWIAEYIIALYRYGLAIASVMAVLSIMIGGIIYLTSAGYPSRTEQAKKIIIGAISGLIIIIFSYMLLILINPELTELPSIKVEAIKEEVLTKGKNCVDLDENKVSVIVPGESEPVAPTEGNAGKFLCDHFYKVQAKEGSGVIVGEGESCEGNFCVVSGEVCFESECIKPLFYGNIVYSGNRYIDVIRIYTPEQLMNADLFVEGHMPTPIESFEVSGLDKYIIPRSQELMQEISQYSQIILNIEVNDSGAETAKVALDIEEGSLIGTMVSNVAGSVLPTWDDDYFLDEDPDNPGWARWINPLCKICIYAKPRNSGWFSATGCFPWSTAKLLAKKEGIRLNINTDDFHEDTTLKCVAANKLTSTNVVGGGQCLPSEGWTRKDGFDCRPAGVGIWQWTKGEEDQVCDNYVNGLSEDSIIEPLPSENLSTEQLAGLSAAVCPDPEVDCVYTGAKENFNSVVCKKAANNPASSVYCYGICLSGGQSAIVSTAGDPCIGKTTCNPDVQGNQLFCDKDKNTCQYGEYGDHCLDSDFACNISKGLKCNNDKEFCRKFMTGEQWQICDKEADCKQGLECVEVEYIKNSDSCAKINFDDPGDQDYEICWPKNKDNDEEGVCFCNDNSDCENNIKWPEAKFCNTEGDNYCTEIKQGARCDADDMEMLAEYSEQFFCNELTDRFTIKKK